ncbi:hypothetical protein DSM14862_03828 (plasmid) [Sulfitobacter indolifex]|uniref:Uncharacterized protein n=1 Tax=Sulfitobacter indolifex HEL-45 TaxID=391624 RepID=A0ABM9X0D6_9RHOB|nr:hypothetical protein OIHEL45_19631 [Sulfitobacter indolifex HEL-45]UOA20989.1 hypothetical protein DSM14862_03828 [Sulfitobacter indolifex]
MDQVTEINRCKLSQHGHLGRKLRIGLSGGLSALTVFLAGNHLASLDEASDMNSSPTRWLRGQ